MQNEPRLSEQSKPTNDISLAVLEHQAAAAHAKVQQIVQDIEEKQQVIEEKQQMLKAFEAVEQALNQSIACVKEAQKCEQRPTKKQRMDHLK